MRPASRSIHPAWLGLVFAAAAVPAWAQPLEPEGAGAAILAGREGGVSPAAAGGDLVFFTWHSADPGAPIPEGGLGPLAHFTPRLSGFSLRLAPLATGADRAGSAGSGFGLRQDFGVFGDGLTLSLGLGTAGGAGDEGRMAATTGFAGRLSIAAVSFGAAWALPTSGSLAGPPPMLGRSPGGPSYAPAYGFDVSYSFGPGSLSLSRFAGASPSPFGAASGSESDVFALSGRYAFGADLDMSAWLARGRIGEPGEDDGWTAITGVRLSF